MTRYLALTLGCLLCTLSLSTGDEVPSIAISCGNTPLDALPKYQQSMDTLGFKKLLSSLWNEDTKVLMVLEDELSLEDFTLKGKNNTNIGWILYATLVSVTRISDRETVFVFFNSLCLFFLHFKYFFCLFLVSFISVLFKIHILRK